MTSEITGVVFMFACTVALAIPYGRYIAKVFADEPTLFDPVFRPVEKLFFRISSIDPGKGMTWQEHLVAILVINMLWFFLGMFVLLNQGWLPLNPDHNPSMTADCAFNTAISFISNTNLQHYSGETGATYLSQLILQLFQFISAGTGIAAVAVLFMGLKAKSTVLLGNFYNFLLKSCSRILLPPALILATILVFNGTPETFRGKDTIKSYMGVPGNVSRGPAAGMVAIKECGTNGGGFFGANSAHPLENPDYLSNITENMAILFIPVSLVFALGFFLKRKKLSMMIFGVMTAGFLLFAVPAVILEMRGNPALTPAGIDQSHGNMEGKEVRFGAAASACWAISTTVTSNGSVNSMHDSFTPLAGMMTMLGMMINCFYGGVGVGILNLYVFIIIAVFISGLMVGRTPEFMGKKVEAKEMKIAMLVFLVHPLLILSGTAISSWIIHVHPGYIWLGNPGFHGFSEMLYEYSSSSANNGSEFAGLAATTPWWNISDGFVMLLSRFLPIIGPVAIAGLLAGKKYIPESAGTLKAETTTFGIMVFAVISILVALSFFIGLALGPIAEYLS